MIVHVRIDEPIGIDEVDVFRFDLATYVDDRRWVFLKYMMIDRVKSYVSVYLVA